jgi:hypothetical protein
MPEIIAPDDTRAAALSDPLTVLLDRRLALIVELIAVDKAIYEEQTNRLQGQIGAVLGPIDRRLAALELGR